MPNTQLLAICLTVIGCGLLATAVLLLMIHWRRHAKLRPPTSPPHNPVDRALVCRLDALNRLEFGGEKNDAAMLKGLHMSVARSKTHTLNRSYSPHCPQRLRTLAGFLMIRFLAFLRQYETATRSLFRRSAPHFVAQARINREFRQQFLEFIYQIRQAGHDLTTELNPQLGNSISSELTRWQQGASIIPQDILLPLLIELDPKVSGLGLLDGEALRFLAAFPEENLHTLLLDTFPTKSAALLLALLPPVRANLHLEILPPQRARACLDQLAQNLTNYSLLAADRIIQILKSQFIIEDYGYLQSRASSFCRNLFASSPPTLVKELENAFTRHQQNRDLFESAIANLVASRDTRQN